MTSRITVLAQKVRSTDIIDAGPLSLAQINVDTLTEKTVANGVHVPVTVKTDLIREHTAAAGVSMGSVVKADTVKVDTLQEKTAAAGSNFATALKVGGVPVSAPLTLVTSTDPLSGSASNMYAATTVQFGVQCQDVGGKWVKSISFWMKKTGAPTGIVYLCFLGGAVKVYYGSLNPAGLTGAFVKTTFTFTSPVYIGYLEYLVLEYGGGDASNNINVELGLTTGTRALTGITLKTGYKTTPVASVSGSMTDYSATGNAHIEVVTAS